MNKKRILLTLILVVAFWLRVWRLDSIPASLSGDEVDIGYHAYSLLRTGKDYLGNLLPVHLQSLADYKSSLYAYFSIPTVALFGISSWGVRLPAVLFGVLGIWLFYLLVDLITRNKPLALVAAFLLSISPWHIQYSRGGFEGMLVLSLYLGGVYFFLGGLENGRRLVMSAVLLGLTIWAYHSAKIFLPVTAIVIVTIWWRPLKRILKKYLLLAVTVFVVITVPVLWSTLLGSGANRFGSTSVFNDPRVVPEIESARLRDIKMREDGDGLLVDRLFHNKVVSWGSILVGNYLQSFSTDFLFIKGDPNPRHSIVKMGEFYGFQFLFLMIGIVYFFIKPMDKKIKLFMVFWLLTAPLPSVVTRDGGYHASRLLFLLPPLVFLISLGMYYSWEALYGVYRKVFIGGLIILFGVGFIFYQHNFWVHYPWDSQRFWHAGFKEAIQTAVLEGKKYDRVIISQADEPALLFFLGYSQYPPEKFQKSYPLPKVDMAGFGLISKLDKFYFPPIGQGVGLYDLGKILPDDTLYMAAFKEINLDLIREPERVPQDVKLIKAISYPSGDPAFYLFTRARKD